MGTAKKNSKIFSPTTMRTAKKNNHFEESGQTSRDFLKSESDSKESRDVYKDSSKSD